MVRWVDMMPVTEEARSINRRSVDADYQNMHHYTTPIYRDDHYSRRYKSNYGRSSNCCTDYIYYTICMLLLFLLLLGSIANITIGSIKMQHILTMCDLCSPTYSSPPAVVIPEMSVDKISSEAKIDYILQAVSYTLPRELDSKVSKELVKITGELGRIRDVMLSTLVDLELNLGVNQSFKLSSGKNHRCCARCVRRALSNGKG